MSNISLAEILALYFIAVATTAVIYLSWLLLVVSQTVSSKFRKLTSDKLRLVRFSAFFFFYSLGLMILVLVPAVNNESLGIAMFRGAVFGLFTIPDFDGNKWRVLNLESAKQAITGLAWKILLGWSISVLVYNIFTAIFI